MAAYDDFVGTRLNPSRFPTAHELNTGEGHLMQVREARYEAKLLKHTDAFMSQGQKRWVQASPGHFLHDPQYSEDQFEGVCGRLVPDDYLARFERTLYLIHCTCAVAFTVTSAKVPLSRSGRLRSQKAGLSRFTDVIYLDIDASDDHEHGRRIMLNVVNTRPCAESFGFLRLLLYEMARNCLFYKAKLVVDGPVPATLAIVKRAWPNGICDAAGHEFSVEFKDLEYPERALAVQELLLQVPPPDRIAELVVQFVEAQPRSTKFGSGPLLVDAFFDFAQESAPAILHVRPDIILSFFLDLDSARAQRIRSSGQWVIRPVMKRDAAHMRL